MMQNLLPSLEDRSAEVDEHEAEKNHTGFARDTETRMDQILVCVICLPFDAVNLDRRLCSLHDPCRHCSRVENWHNLHLRSTSLYMVAG